MNEKQLCLFAVWFFNEYHKTGGVINKTISHIVSWKNAQFGQIHRKNYLTLQNILKQYKKENPTTERRTRPITKTILKMFLSKLNDSEEHITIASALIIAYYHLLRSGEYTIEGTTYKRDPKKRLNWSNFKIGNNNKGNPSVLEISLYHTKNKKVICERTLSTCHCHKKELCAVHAYIKLRNLKLKLHGKIDLKEPIFTDKNGKWFTATKMNRIISELALKSGLDPTFYFAHGARSGRATDMKLQGCEDFVIKKQGRWESEVFEKHYLKLDMYDVERLRMSQEKDKPVCFSKK